MNSAIKEERAGSNSYFRSPTNEGYHKTGQWIHARINLASTLVSVGLAAFSFSREFREEFSGAGRDQPDNAAMVENSQFSMPHSQSAASSNLKRNNTHLAKSAQFDKNFAEQEEKRKKWDQRMFQESLWTVEQGITLAVAEYKSADLETTSYYRRNI